MRAEHGVVALFFLALSVPPAPAAGLTRHLEIKLLPVSEGGPPSTCAVVDAPQP